MMSQLKDIIPGAEHFPRFVRNASEQYEARLSLVEVSKTPSLFYQGMEGSRMLIVTSHGEGRAEFPSVEDAARVNGLGLVTTRWVDNHGRVAESYPANPNGSPHGIAGLTTRDGRFTITMPHPGACTAPCSTRGGLASGATTAPGCACSATPASGWAERRGFAGRGAGPGQHPARSPVP